jgi:hypothetical protein
MNPPNDDKRQRLDVVLRLFWQKNIGVTKLEYERILKSIDELL